MACGDWPAKHGGQMNDDGCEIAFELLGQGRAVAQVPRALQMGDEVVADVSLANGSIAQARFTYGVEVQLHTQFGASRGVAASNGASRLP